MGMEWVEYASTSSSIHRSILEMFWSNKKCPLFYESKFMYFKEKAVFLNSHFPIDCFQKNREVNNPYYFLSKS